MDRGVPQPLLLDGLTCVLVKGEALAPEPPLSDHWGRSGYLDEGPDAAELVSVEMTPLPAHRQWCCCFKTRLLSQIYCQGTLLYPVDLPAHVWGLVTFPL